MANSAPVSIRGNSMPAGGFTAQQPVAPTGASNSTTLDELIANLTPAVQKFRAASSPLKVNLDSVSLSGNEEVYGASPAVRIPNVGLGYRLIREHNVTVTIDNTAATAVTIAFGARFPWDFINSTVLDINGGGTPYNASGWGGLLVAGRGRPGFFKSSGAGFNGLSRSLVRVSATNGTLNENTGGQWSPSGYQSVTIAATTTCTLNITFYTVEKLAKDRTGLIGALPLQNNSTYATLTTNLVGNPTGSNPTSPLYVTGGFPSTATVTVTGYDIVGSYSFWSVPSDATLYAEMVANSYQVQEAKAVSIPSTGPEAFTYDLPQNCYFGAAHLFAVDANGDPLPFNSLSPFRILYNAGSVRPVIEYAGRMRAEQYFDYDADLANLPGYTLWDGDATSESILDTDDTGWINTYKAASPQIVADVADSVAAPGKTSITREVLVSGSVVVVA